MEEQKTLVPMENQQDFEIGFEDFVKEILYKNPTLLEKANSTIGNIPILVKLFSNIDPTGITGIISDINDEMISKIQKDRYERMFYELFLALQAVNKEVNKGKCASEEEIAIQIELFMKRSLDESQSEKLVYFRNILCNGIVNSDGVFDHVQFVWNAISNLTGAEIKVLVFSVQHMEIEKKEGIAPDTEKAINVIDDAQKFNLDRAYLQSICYCLQGKGFLRPCSSTPLMASQTLFYPTDFAVIVHDYVQNFDK